MTLLVLLIILLIVAAITWLLLSQYQLSSGSGVMPNMGK